MGEHVVAKTRMLLGEAMEDVEYMTLAARQGHKAKVDAIVAFADIGVQMIEQPLPGAK